MAVTVEASRMVMEGVMGMTVMIKWGVLEAVSRMSTGANIALRSLKKTSIVKTRKSRPAVTGILRTSEGRRK